MNTSERMELMASWRPKNSGLMNLIATVVPSAIAIPEKTLAVAPSPISRSSAYLSLRTGRCIYQTWTAVKIILIKVIKAPTGFWGFGVLGFRSRLG